MFKVIDLTFTMRDHWRWLVNKRLLCLDLDI